MNELITDEDINKMAQKAIEKLERERKIQRLKEAQENMDDYTDLLRRIKELYQNIKNDNIECPDATEYTQGAKGHKRYVLNLFDTCVPEAKEAQDDAD